MTDRPGTVIGEVRVVAEAEVIKASDVESEPAQEDDET